MGLRRRIEGEEYQAGLEKLGLSTNEAKVYLALLERGRLGAPALIEITGVPRGTIYPVLTSLTDRGLIQVGAGYGGRYQALPPGQAVTTLMRWEREALAERERLAVALAKELEPLAAKSAEDLVAEPIEVLRDQRVLTERFEQLHRETREKVSIFIKAPFLVPSMVQENQLVLDARRRRVELRDLYEKAVFDDPNVAPYVRGWIETGGESRVFDSALPHKLAVFDGRAAIVPMTGSNSESGTTTNLVIRDAAVVAGLQALFDAFWERSQPLRATDLEPKGGKRTSRAQAEAH